MLQVKALVQVITSTFKNTLNEDEQADIKQAVEQLEEIIKKLDSDAESDSKVEWEQLQTVLQNLQSSLKEIEKTASDDAKVDLQILENIIDKLLQKMHAKTEKTEGTLSEKLQETLHEIKSGIDNIKSKVPEAAHTVVNTAKSLVDKVGHLLDHLHLKKRSAEPEPLQGVVSPDKGASGSPGKRFPLLRILSIPRLYCDGSHAFCVVVDYPLVVHLYRDSNKWCFPLMTAKLFFLGFVLLHGLYECTLMG
uniref:Uncharacterized protein n=1 Tax=Pogona vitticeps TaxID=103695 RepID=A0ABM5ESD2_9SAUR